MRTMPLTTIRGLVSSMLSRTGFVCVINARVPAVKSNSVPVKHCALTDYLLVLKLIGSGCTAIGSGDAAFICEHYTDTVTSLPTPSLPSF